MSRPPDEPFQLSFQVAQDRTLRRLGLVRLGFGITFVVSLVVLSVLYSFSNENPNGLPSTLSPKEQIFFFFTMAMLVATIPGFWLTNVYESIIMTRRYGWRAVSDPIEAQRVATREALYDVATGSTRAVPQDDGEHLTVIPTKRLRPAAVRLQVIGRRPYDHQR